MRKFYFGWYKWNGRIFCERWHEDIPSVNECFVKTEISQKEWDEPLSLLEARYSHLIPENP